MTCLDRQDGSCSGEQAGVGEEVGCAKIRCDANILDDAGCGSHGADVGDERVKVELAGGYGLGSEALDGRLEDGGVGGFIGLDCGELFDGDLT